MIGALRAQLSESLGALRAVFANPGLRRLELAWVGSVTGEWSYVVALAVFAFDAGGAAAVGLVGLIRFLPAAAVAPFAALLGDRFRRERVMLAADAVRALGLAGAAVAVAISAPAGLVYALAALVSLVSTAFQPAQAALLPSLARRPEELTAANVASSTIESVGTFLGPALGGLLLAATSPTVVFAATAGTFVWSALMVARIPAPDREEREERRDVVGQALAGFRAVLGDARVRLLVGLYAAQTLVAGALNVLIVVTALELLDLGEAGVGFLNSAVGVGGLVGAVAALTLVGRRLAGGFGVGIVLWGLPILLVGVWPDRASVLVFLGLVGIGNTLVDVAALTLLQRAIPDDVLARVFGVLESLILASVAVGAVIAPVLIAGLGTRGALVATGAFLPVLAALAWRRLAALDAGARVPGRELALLRGVPIFAPLPAATLEHLAARLAPVSLAAGETLFRQGDPGDRFYVLGGGEVEVSAGGRELSALGPGGYLGEIALLNDVPRTATVTARTQVELFALERGEFLTAVTGHAASAAAADAVIADRLGAPRTGLASI